MALNAKLKEYIDDSVRSGKMTQEYANGLTTHLANAPDEFQGGWLRQNDYDRSMAAVTKAKSEWETWGTDAKMTLANTNAQLVAATGRISELEGKLAEAAPGMDHDEVVKEVRALAGKINELSSVKMVTQDELNLRVAEAAQKAKLEAVGFMGEYSQNMDRIAHEYRGWSGKELSPDDKSAIVDFANARAKELGRPVPLNEAFQSKYAEDRQKAWEEKRTQEIRREVETSFRPPIPGGGYGGGNSEMGPLQQRLMKENGNSDLSAVSNSLQEAKVAAAEALRRDGSS